ASLKIYEVEERVCLHEGASVPLGNSHLPVLDLQTRDTTKLPGAMRHQDETMQHGNRGDLEVIRSDGSAGGLESSTDAPVEFGCRIVERERGEWRQEGVESSPCSGGV